MELSSISRHHRVLLRLRRLRREPDGAGGMGGRRDRAPSARESETATAPRRIATTRKTSTISPGPRVPSSSSGAIDSNRRRESRKRRRRTGAGRVATADSSRARRAGAATLRRGEARAQVLLGMVRSVSLQPSDGRRSGVITAKRTAWSIRRSSPPARRSWSPAPITFRTPEEVVIHEAGHQFFYGIVGTNEFEDAWMDEGINTYASARAMLQDGATSVYERRFFGGFVPWVAPTSSGSRNGVEPAARLSACAEERSAVRPLVPLPPGDRPNRHLQQDRTVAEHARAASRLGDRPADPVDLLHCAGSSNIRSRTISSASPTECLARTLAGFSIRSIAARTSSTTPSIS